MLTVDEALALIPGRRDLLNHTNDALARQIRHTEEALKKMRPSVPSEVHYETEDGSFVLSFCKHKGDWRIMHGREDSTDDDDAPLSTVNQQYRADVFTVPLDGRLAPIEQLVVAVAESLEEIFKERSPLLEVAARLRAALERAGFPDEEAA